MTILLKQYRVGRKLSASSSSFACAAAATEAPEAALASDGDDGDDGATMAYLLIRFLARRYFCGGAHKEMTLLEADGGLIGSVSLIGIVGNTVHLV